MQSGTHYRPKTISPPIHVTITWHLPPMQARILITSSVSFLCSC